MEEQWEVIFSSTKRYRVEILKSLLLEENIPAVIVDKQDSSYLIFGEIELYVERADILEAKRIVEKFLADE
jgi:hypothetical protein